MSPDEWKALICRRPSGSNLLILTTPETIL
jgi:hypothetical protein